MNLILILLLLPLQVLTRTESPFHHGQWDHEEVNEQEMKSYSGYKSCKPYTGAKPTDPIPSFENFEKNRQLSKIAELSNYPDFVQLFKIFIPLFFVICLIFVKKWTSKRAENDEQADVFICVKYPEGQQMGRVLELFLQSRRYRVVFGRTTISLKNIRSCRFFVVCCTGNCLENENTPGQELFYKQLKWAEQNLKHIVPVWDNEFQSPDRNAPELPSYIRNFLHLSPIVTTGDRALKELLQRLQSFDMEEKRGA